MSLSQDDLEQLISLNKNQFSVKSGFWVTAEKALQDSDAYLQLHKCFCGVIICATEEYVKKSVHNFKRIRGKRTGKCWHKQAVENNILAHDQKNLSLLERASVNLKKHPNNPRIFLETFGLLPMDMSSTPFFNNHSVASRW